VPPAADRSPARTSYPARIAAYHDRPSLRFYPDPGDVDCDHETHVSQSQVNPEVSVQKRTTVTLALQCPFCDAQTLLRLVTRTTTTKRATLTWRSTICEHEWSAIRSIQPTADKSGKLTP